MRLRNVFLRVMAWRGCSFGSAQDRLPPANVEGQHSPDNQHGGVPLCQ